MAECKCTEINNLANDIEVLSEICTKICTYSSHATEIVRKILCWLKMKIIYIVMDIWFQF